MIDDSLVHQTPSQTPPYPHTYPNVEYRGRRQLDSPKSRCVCMYIGTPAKYRVPTSELQAMVIWVLGLANCKHNSISKPASIYAVRRFAKSILD